MWTHISYLGSSHTTVYCFSQQKEPTTKILRRRSYNRIRTNNNLSVVSQLLKANKIKPLARFKTLNISNSLLWRTHWGFHRVNDLWQPERTVYYSKIVLHALECRTARTFISSINPKPGEQTGQRKKKTPKVSAKLMFFEIFLTWGLGFLLNPGVDCLQHTDALLLNVSCGYDHEHFCVILHQISLSLVQMGEGVIPWSQWCWLHWKAHPTDLLVFGIHKCDKWQEEVTSDHLLHLQHILQLIFLNHKAKSDRRAVEEMKLHSVVDD